LSALDASFLEVESPAAHMHVGWVARFRGREGRRAPSVDELRDHIAGRLAAAPRYRQRLASVPLAVHDPVWADDPDFRIADCAASSPSAEARANLKTMVPVSVRGDTGGELGNRSPSCSSSCPAPRPNPWCD
jgi:hypothetical protein